MSVRLYGYPWVLEGSFPMIAPCFRVTAVDDTGVKHHGVPDSSSYSPACDGTGSFWFWPPVPAQAKQLRVIVSTLWEAAWALIDIPAANSPAFFGRTQGSGTPIEHEQPSAHAHDLSVRLNSGDSRGASHIGTASGGNSDRTGPLTPLAVRLLYQAPPWPRRSGCHPPGCTRSWPPPTWMRWTRRPATSTPSHASSTPAAEDTRLRDAGG